MGDVEELFTDRASALKAARHLLHGDGPTRVLVFTGVSGTGKSTLLAHIAAKAPHPSRTHLLDAAQGRASLAVPSEGGEHAALELLRSVAVALACGAPWWRRRRVRRRAAALGTSRKWTVRVRQWASRGGVITHSPVTVTAARPTQAERRAGWVTELAEIAHAVRRRQSVLLIDTCEWLMFFDDVHAEQPRPGQPLGVGAWFAGVLDQVLNEIPGLRVVVAGTAVPGAWRNEGAPKARYRVHDLAAWKAADVRAYLARRGLPESDGLAEAISERSQGLPAEVAWIADALTGSLSDDHAADSTATVIAMVKDLEETVTGDRQEWLRTHVLSRISDRNRHLLNAAAILSTFTSQALHTVAFHPGFAAAAPAQDDDWFDPLRRMSCLREVPASRGHWTLHPAIRDWLVTAMSEDDAHRMPDERRLPRLHQAAAVYYEALSDGAFSTQAAHHRFWLGDHRHVGSWTAHVVRALETVAVDGLSLHVLTEAALTVADLRTTLPRLYADAHLVRAFLTSQTDHNAAQEHAEVALRAYQDIGHKGVCRAALLAGQAAWNRKRYAEAAAHWTVALQTGGPAPSALRAAAAEAVSRTGDLHRADELLAQALQHAQTDVQQVRHAAESPQPAQPAGVSDTVPCPLLADAVRPSLRLAHLHVLISENSARLCDWTRSAQHSDSALEHADDDPHVTALAHRNHADHATYVWDLRKAERHIKAGLAAARSCSDKRCIALLQLARADLAERKARWAPPRPADEAIRSSPTPTTMPVIAPSTAATKLSLDERAEAAHQMNLAATARATAFELATELGDIRTVAQSITGTEPALALDIFRAIGDRLGEAEALADLADIARRRGDLESSKELSLEAQALFRDLGDRLGQAYSLEALVELAKNRGDALAAERLAGESLRVFRALDDGVGEAHALRSLAEIARRRDDLELAEQRGLEALAVSRTLGDRLGQAHTLDDLADTALRRGDMEVAEQRAREALTLSRITGDVPGQTNALKTLAEVAGFQGDVSEAEKWGLQALTVSRTIGTWVGQAHILFRLSEFAQRRGDLDLAEERGLEALALYRGADDMVGQANALIALTASARARGNLDLAEERGLKAVALARRGGDLLGDANALIELAAVGLARGDLDVADERGLEALTLARRGGDLLGQANALCVRAETALARGDTATAHTVLGQAAVLYDDAGLPGAAEDCRKRQHAQ
ncbi:hypothetical protein GR925_32370 [Streptomyces sp. HUCO-GS316]|uniref:tetratricopeptide repeat protein n=1 Tax=Streptomyces sp. HUCO-GS316 TaxID=2692198 RepID=UPI00136BB128|nr:hypothetical protein [Streptomyces sp. HUCO-GS316]